jgi:hypothetical protein
MNPNYLRRNEDKYSPTTKPVLLKTNESRVTLYCSHFEHTPGLRGNQAVIYLPLKTNEDIQLSQCTKVDIWLKTGNRKIDE